MCAKPNEGPLQLVVEGADDLHVIAALCELNQIPQFFIKDCSGVDDALRSFEVRVRTGSRATHVGLVIDADDRVSDRWKDAWRCLFPGAGPSGRQEEGYIGTVNGKQCGIWLMPDNLRDGAIEDLVISLMRPSDDQFPLVNEFVDNLPSQRFKTKDLAAARIHTWLGIQENPGRPMGESIRRRMLESSSDLTSPFLSWIRRLFGFPAEMQAGNANS